MGRPGPVGKPTARGRGLVPVMAPDRSQPARAQPGRSGQLCQQLVPPSHSGDLLWVAGCIFSQLSPTTVNEHVGALRASVFLFFSFLKNI